MGQQYAEMFPDRIRAMVLDGNVDHSLRTPWELISAEAEPFERNVEAFIAWYDQTPACPRYGSATTRVPFMTMPPPGPRSRR